MSMNILSKFSGASLALMAASLANSAEMAATGSKMAASDSVELVHCAGLNTCAGVNDCKSATNECKGQASCHGQSFTLASKASCDNMGGKIVDPGKTATAAASSQVHCMGANMCKGHNDCKTADNACKGQGSCKGKGFVALPAASCKAVGGKAG
jgi:hypothetical protein